MVESIYWTLRDFNFNIFNCPIGVRLKFLPNNKPGGQKNPRFNPGALGAFGNLLGHVHFKHQPFGN